MIRRQTFLDEPPQTCGKRHLRIVITELSQDNELLTVPLDTFHGSFQDTSCIINQGEHPFVKTRSFINYRYAKVLSFTQVFNGLQKGLFIRKEDVSEELLKRIQDRAKRTKHLAQELKCWFALF